MEWQHLATFNLTESWQHSGYINTRSFRVTHQVDRAEQQKLIALVTLINLSEEGENTEIFKPQRIQYRTESEIIQFPNPPRGWQYGIAVKQLTLPNQTLSNWEIKIDMPVVDLQPEQPPINSAASTAKNRTTVAVSTTPTKLLSAATVDRKHATFFNSDTKNSVYIDTDSTVNNTSAIANVGSKKIYVSDIPNWQGEYWAVAASGTINVDVEEYV
ncbi:MAG: hypothetical protein ACRCZS_16830 [Chroococcidiopsis sp.]